MMSIILGITAISSPDDDLVELPDQQDNSAEVYDELVSDLAVAVNQAVINNKYYLS